MRSASDFSHPSPVQVISSTLCILSLLQLPLTFTHPAMSTLNSATLASDDEEDRDFVPVAPKPKRKRPAGTKRTRAERDGSASGSGSSSASDSDDEDVGELEEGEAKRLKVEQEEAEARKRKEAAKEAYRSLLEGDEPTPGTADKVGKDDQVEMVDIKRPRQFAGETI